MEFGILIPAIPLPEKSQKECGPSDNRNYPFHTFKTSLYHGGTSEAYSPFKVAVVFLQKSLVMSFVASKCDLFLQGKNR